MNTKESLLKLKYLAHKGKIASLVIVILGLLGFFVSNQVEKEVDIELGKLDAMVLE
jgi:hypothetical protein